MYGTPASHDCLSISKHCLRTITNSCDSCAQQEIAIQVLDILGEARQEETEDGTWQARIRGWHPRKPPTWNNIWERKRYTKLRCWRIGYTTDRLSSCHIRHFSLLNMCSSLLGVSESLPFSTAAYHSLCFVVVIVQISAGHTSPVDPCYKTVTLAIKSLLLSKWLKASCGLLCIGHGSGPVHNANHYVM